MAQWEDRGPAVRLELGIGLIIAKPLPRVPVTGLFMNHSPGDYWTQALIVSFIIHLLLWDDLAEGSSIRVYE